MGMTTPTPDQLRGWTPIRLGGTVAAPIVDWCHTEGERFEDPFFDQSVERCLRRPFNLLFRHQTAMETLGQVAAAGDALPLAGLVFHCSRCGSTLISQMLSRVASVRVLAEPGPLHSVLSVLSADPGISEERRRDWLRWTIAALGRSHPPEQRHLVIKLDAWAVFSLPMILNAFPATPWIFVYRDPIEVMVSHLGHRGYHMIPGTLAPELFGLDAEEAVRLAPEQYLARVLAALLQACAEAAAPVAPAPAKAAALEETRVAPASAGPPSSPSTPASAGPPTAESKAASTGPPPPALWPTEAMAAAAPAPAERHGRSMLVEYRELPDAVAGRIAPLFGIEVTPGDLVAMTEMAARDAKNPFVAFGGDSAAKQGHASERVREAAEQWAQPWYQMLESYRTGRR
jgi:hypothetical protein